MKFSSTIVTTLLAALSASLVHAQITKPQCTVDWAGSPEDLETEQQDAFSNFAGLLVIDRNAQVAFDLYVPGEYINHSPNVASGRENALAVLVPALRNPALRIGNTEWSSGQGYGYIHYRSTLNGTSSVVIERFRMEGTCVVEHWESIQPIVASSVNPIAYF